MSSKQELFLGKNSDIYWKPTLAINADPAKLVVDLAEGIKGYRGSDDWINELREKDNVKEDINLYVFVFFIYN